jgi:hypothetical protein
LIPAHGKGPRPRSRRPRRDIPPIEFAFSKHSATLRVLPTQRSRSATAHIPSRPPNPQWYCPSCIAPAKASTKPGPSGGITSTRSSEHTQLNQRGGDCGRLIAQCRVTHREIIPCHRNNSSGCDRSSKTRTTCARDGVHIKKRSATPRWAAVWRYPRKQQLRIPAVLHSPELFELGVSTGHSTLFTHPSHSQYFP